MIKDPEVRGMTKVKACEAILQYTKQPEVVKGELTIGIENNDTIEDLREVTEQLAGMFKESIEKKVKNLKDINEANIIEVKKNNEEDVWEI